MRALVTGGTGLFGKKTCLALLGDPEFERVVAFDVAPPSDAFRRLVGQHGDRFVYVRGDVSQLEELLAAARANRVDRMVNLAMILSKDPNPRGNTRVGVLGMCNVFEAARLLGIERVVFASSETVYGTQDDYGDRAVKETDRLLPFTGSFYALAKALAEVVAAQYQELYGIQSTAMRPTIGYGHGGKDPKFVRWFSEIVSLPAVGEPVALDCTGDALFSLILADEVGEFVRRALKTASSPHPAYNLGGPPCSLKDVAAVVEKLIPGVRITFGTEPESCELPWKVDCTLAQEDYGFSTMPLEEAVLRHANEARAEAGLAPLSW